MEAVSMSSPMDTPYWTRFWKVPSIWLAILGRKDCDALDVVTKYGKIHKIRLRYVGQPNAEPMRMLCLLYLIISYGRIIKLHMAVQGKAVGEWHIKMASPVHMSVVAATDEIIIKIEYYSNACVQPHTIGPDNKPPTNRCPSAYVSARLSVCQLAIVICFRF